MDLTGIYVGIVEQNNDPERLGRIKVRVPHIYGIIGGTVGAIPMDDMPWAIPLGLPSGGSSRSGGADWLPEPGDQVCVQFLDGEPEKPVWSWLMQTKDQAKAFKLHQYTETDGKVGKPKRGAWTRYGHTVEWNAGSITMSTASGYQIFLLDKSTAFPDGQVMLRTAAGQMFMINDEGRDATLFLLDDFYIQLGQSLNVMCNDASIETMTGDLTLTLGNQLTAYISGLASITGYSDFELLVSGDVRVDGQAALTVASSAEMLLDYGTTLNLGVGSIEPFVLGNRLRLFLENLLLWLALHTHSSGEAGSPTSPPIVTPYGTIQPLTQEILSTTIFGA